MASFDSKESSDKDNLSNSSEILNPTSSNLIPKTDGSMRGSGRSVETEVPVVDKSTDDSEDIAKESTAPDDKANKAQNETISSVVSGSAVNSSTENLDVRQEVVRRGVKRCLWEVDHEQVSFTQILKLDFNIQFII